jgi:hypothetical protein
LAALRDTENVPDTVGVPEITPVLEAMVSPAGKPEATKEFGFSLAVVA